MMPTAHEIFEAELRARGIAYNGPDAEGLYYLESHGSTLTVSLENIARDFERDGDVDAVRRFVDRVADPFLLPDWSVAQDLLYLSAESREMDLEGVVYGVITGDLAKVLVLTDPDESKITWVIPSMLESWGVTSDEAIHAAEANLDKLLVGRAPEIAGEIDGMALAMIPIPSVFKASVIFAPGFKAFISQALDWPVYAVIPCRDFIYVLAEKDRELLGRLGGVVIREYERSGYPITLEILHITDTHIDALGRYQAPPTQD